MLTEIFVPNLLKPKFFWTEFSCEKIVTKFFGQLLFLTKIYLTKFFLANLLTNLFCANSFRTQIFVCQIFCWLDSFCPLIFLLKLFGPILFSTNIIRPEFSRTDVFVEIFFHIFFASIYFDKKILAHIFLSDNCCFWDIFFQPTFF